jgi:hypothetical protein
MHEYPLGALSVSFQRYPYPHEGFVTELPTSCGALPFLIERPGRLLLPCPTGESFWIGLVPSPMSQRYLLRVLVRTASGKRLNAATGAEAHDTGRLGLEDLPSPTMPGVPGIVRGEGTWWSFARNALEPTRPACHGLEIHCRSRDTPPTPQTSDRRPQHSMPGGGNEQGNGEARPRPPGGESSPTHVDDEESESLLVDLTEPEHFQALGGERLEPLNPRDRYGGWRLP